MSIQQWLRDRLPHLPRAAAALTDHGHRYRLAWLSARARAGDLDTEVLGTRVELRRLIERLRERRHVFQFDARLAEQHGVDEDVTMNHLVAFEIQKIVDELEDLAAASAP
jgi:hypothetical protein